MRRVYETRGGRFALAAFFVVWLSLAQWKVLERIVLSDPVSTGFVVESVRGILAGTPVYQSWQHRFVGPWIVRMLGGANVEAVARFSCLAVVCANLLLVGLAWRRRESLAVALRWVACWGLAHFVLAYKLEYPWDGIDSLVFLAFGCWARSGVVLARLSPVLLLGTFNHETILYLPAWYLLARERKTQLAALGAAAVVFGVILGTRALFYRGQPDLPGQVFEPLLPVVGNPSHVAHNFQQLVLHNWRAGRAHLSVGFAGATVAFGALAVRSETRQAALWSLFVLATVLVFGYVNETRLYLPLAAFWTTYGLRGASRGPG